MLLNKNIIIIILVTLSINIYADYSVDSNNDGKIDIWVKDLENKCLLISSDTNFDGKIDSRLSLDEFKLSIYEETDYNLDGVMDNFYYFESGNVIRQEVDSNYDQKIDVWVYITNNGKSISKYEKDLNFDGVIDKVKEFEVSKEDVK